jgi:hypothetical protein
MLIRLKRPKVICSPSYADYRPKTHAVILWDMGHTKGKLCTVGIGQGTETKNLKRLMCLWHRNEYRNLKPAKATMGSGLVRSKEDW